MGEDSKLIENLIDAADLKNKKEFIYKGVNISIKRLADALVEDENLEGLVNELHRSSVRASIETMFDDKETALLNNDDLKSEIEKIASDYMCFAINPSHDSRSKEIDKKAFLLKLDALAERTKHNRDKKVIGNMCIYHSIKDLRKSRENQIKLLYIPLSIVSLEIAKKHKIDSVKLYNSVRDNMVINKADVIDSLSFVLHNTFKVRYPKVMEIVHEMMIDSLTDGLWSLNNNQIKARLGLRVCKALPSKAYYWELGKKVNKLCSLSKLSVFILRKGKGKAKMTTEQTCEKVKSTDNNNKESKRQIAKNYINSVLANKPDGEAEVVNIICNIADTSAKKDTTSKNDNKVSDIFIWNETAEKLLNENRYKIAFGNVEKVVTEDEILTSLDIKPENSFCESKDGENTGIKHYYTKINPNSYVKCELIYTSDLNDFDKDEYYRISFTDVYGSDNSMTIDKQSMIKLVQNGYVKFAKIVDNSIVFNHDNESNSYSTLRVSSSGLNSVVFTIMNELKDISVDWFKLKSLVFCDKKTMCGVIVENSKITRELSIEQALKLESIKRYDVYTGCNNSLLDTDGINLSNNVTYAWAKKNYKIDISVKETEQKKILKNLVYMINDMYSNVTIMKDEKVYPLFRIWNKKKSMYIEIYCKDNGKMFVVDHSFKTGRHGRNSDYSHIIEYVYDVDNFDFIKLTREYDSEKEELTIRYKFNLRELIPLIGTFEAD